LKLDAGPFPAIRYSPFASVYFCSAICFWDFYQGDNRNTNVHLNQFEKLYFFYIFVCKIKSLPFLITHYALLKTFMTPLETIKNNLIDHIMATKNEKILHAIEKLFESSKAEEVYNLSSQEIEMLAMSEADIVNGNLVSEKELDEQDKKWLA
jgi:hypothetical protein